MKYDIIIAETIYELTSNVNGYIGNGWIPQGGVNTTKNNLGFVEGYIQAVIKGE